MARDLDDPGAAFLNHRKTSQLLKLSDILTLDDGSVTPISSSTSSQSAPTADETGVGVGERPRKSSASPENSSAPESPPHDPISTVRDREMTKAAARLRSRNHNCDGGEAKITTKAAWGNEERNGRRSWGRERGRNYKERGKAERDRILQRERERGEGKRKRCGDILVFNNWSKYSLLFKRDCLVP